MTAFPANDLRKLFALLALAAFAVTHAAAAERDRAREIFRDVYPTVELGDWSVIDRLGADDRQLLESYVLWPDLRAAWLRSNLEKAHDEEIEAFLDEHGTLRPARELRYRYALHLASRGMLERYFRLYEQYYQGLGIERLDCLALQAELAAGRDDRIVGRAIELWLVGRSQVEECDPVFEHLRDRQLLGPVEYRKRYALAVDAREFSLARWLAREIDESHGDESAAWIRAQSDPEKFLREYRQYDNTEATREQLAYAAERLTYRDPELAHKLWKTISGRFGFSERQKLLTARHIALWTARDQLPHAYEWLVRLPQAAWDDEVLRWRARTSLRRETWDHLLRDIDAMSDPERDAEEWQYWKAIALQRTGNPAAARPILEQLAGERSYYGFLAADELGGRYALEQDVLVADEASLQSLAANPALIRARELFLVGLEGRGRSEWDAVVTHLESAEKIQAAILAHRWGWHSRAIATVASLGEYDDLAIRYPLPYFDLFERAASAASISPTWAYGIARSESLFMRDVRSRAGAIGLMQLMPATGRQVATELRLPFNGLATLTDPEANIRLGTTYLGQMASRYAGNAVAATAAYNAGPQRVDAWLPDKGSVDARIWIENIPFNETRTYVKRVMAAQAIFHWRMTGELRRLSEELAAIKPVPGTQQLAAR